MKKLLLIVLSLVLCISVFGCQKEVENESQDDVSSQAEISETSVEEKPVDKYPEATKFIEEGKFEDAYKILFAAREDEEAQQRLSDFEWVAKKINVAQYDTESTETLLELDEKGNILVKTVNYSGGGSEKYTYTYDEQNRVIKEAFTWNDYLSHIETFKYDEFGNIIKNEYASDGFNSVMIATVENGVVVKKETTTDYAKTEELLYYDENGHLSYIEEVIDGVAKKTLSYVYDEEGNIVKETYHGIYDFVTEYFYDENGLNVKTEYYDSSSSNKNSSEYFYDEYGNIVKTIEKSYGEEAITEYFYDEIGRLTKMYQDPEKGGLYYEETLSDYVCFYRSALH